MHKVSIRLVPRIWKSLLLASFVLLASCASTTNYEYGYISHNVEDNSLIIQGNFGQIQISALAGEAIEVFYQQSGVKQLPSYAKAEKKLTLAPSIENNDGEILFSNGKLTASIDKSDLSINFYRGTELLTRQKSYFLSSNKRGFDFTLDRSEKIAGGGERVLGMDRRGHRLPLYNRAHYGYETNSKQMNFSLPAIMSSKKYTILFDNTAKGFLDIGKTEANTLTFEAVAGRTSYMVFAADNYPGLIHNYVDVTGKQPLPPRWAFGHFISRFGYRSEWEVRDVVNRTLEAGIPADAVIIDLFWYGQDMKGNVGNFKWDEHTFPTYQEMLDDLKLSGIKTIVITEPFILGSSFRWQDAVDNEALVKNSDGKPYQYDFFFGNTGLIDVFDDNASQWFWGIYKDIFNQGVAGTWGDLGEPEVHPDDSIHYISEIKSSVRGDAIHNVYGQQWARLVYENQLKLQPDNRPFILMRSGFAGSQRYAMIPWTGDVSRSWGGLKPQVELSLSMGLLGLAYTHSDLGGFAGGKTFDQELYIRWLQYGVFQPIYRPHAQWQIPSEVALHDNKTKDIIRAFIKLRYRMLPYIYTLAYENATTGIPMMRPVFFEDETDASLFDITDAYLWGDSFFVSPVTEPNQSTQTIHLPKGIWFDFWSDKKYGGDQSVDIPVTLETIPVLVRAGSFVPMVGDIMNTEQYSSESMSLHYYADDSVNQSNGTMYEDDGKTHDSIGKKQFELLKFSSVHTADNLTIELSKSVDTYPSMPKQRKIKMVIHNWSKMPQKIVFANKEIPLLYGKEQDKGRETMQEKGQGTTIEEQQNTGYSFNAVKNLLTIYIQWDHEIAKLIVNPARGI